MVSLLLILMSLSGGDLKLAGQMFKELAITFTWASLSEEVMDSKSALIEQR